MNVKNESPETVKLLNKRCFSIQSVQELNSLCSKFLKSVGLSTFEFARVYDNGNAFILYSDPKIAKYVVFNQIHVTAHIPSSILSESFWYLPAHDGPYLQLLRDVKEMSGSGGFVDLIQRFQGYFDMFCFWSPLEQGLASTQFLNNKEKIEQFCYAFRERGNTLIKSVENDSFLLPEKMRANFQGLNSGQLSSTTSNLDFHLNQIRSSLIRSIPSQAQIKFTPREIDCITFLTLGKTSKEIALDLNLSRRTIENYIDNLKGKLGCGKRSQILGEVKKLTLIQ